MSDRLFTFNKAKWNEGFRRFLTFALVALFSFGIASAIVGISISSKHNSAHNDLQDIDYYCRTIIDSFEINVYKESDFQSYYCEFDYNGYSNFTFGTIDGNVQFSDQYLNPEYEIMIISFDSTGYYIEDILLHVDANVRLSLTIFIDGQIFYTSNHLKKDIPLEFDLEVELIELYFF